MPQRGTGKPDEGSEQTISGAVEPLALDLRHLSLILRGEFGVDFLTPTELKHEHKK